MQRGHDSRTSRTSQYDRVRPTYVHSVGREGGGDQSPTRTSYQRRINLVINGLASWSTIRRRRGKWIFADAAQLAQRMRRHHALLASLPDLLNSRLDNKCPVGLTVASITRTWSTLPAHCRTVSSLRPVHSRSVFFTRDAMLPRCTAFSVLLCINVYTAV